MRTKSLVMLLVLAVNLFLVFGAGESWAQQIVTLSRENNYVINSDASYQYETKLLLKNTSASSTLTLNNAFYVFSQTAAVVPTGFNFFERVNSYDSYPVSYSFQHFDTESGSVSLTKNFPTDCYLSSVSLYSGETKAVSVLYSGGAGTWAEKSSNVKLPWGDQTGYWELAGGGPWIQNTDNYTVNVTLPETVTNVKILGWDGNKQQLAYNKFQFTSNYNGTNYYYGNNFDVNLAFKTTTPLPSATVTPEPISSALFLLGAGALAGAGRLRKRKLLK